VSEVGAPRIGTPRSLAVPGLGAARQAKLLTQLELAERAGMNVASISLLETGRRKALYRTVRQLAAALEVAPEALLSAAPAPSARRGNRTTPK
jgi:transcriptional regulator with XRE-family HTH domain